MTIREAIDRVDRLKPNSFTTEEKIAWLSDLDGMVYRELICTHKRPEGMEEMTFDGYSEYTDMGTQLLVPAPYSDVYQHYMAAQIDLGNAELVKYNNDSTLYNNAYATYSDYYTRTHMPLDKGIRHIRL